MISRILESQWRFRILLVVLAAVIFGMPVLSEMAGWDTTASGLTIITFGVLLASGRGACSRMMLPAILVLGLIWIREASPASKLEGVRFMAAAVLLLYSVGITIDYLRHRREIDQESLAAAAAVYLLFGIACGGLYAALSVWAPGGLVFAGVSGVPDLHDHVYFSFVVLTTIGFGDVVPSDALHRSLAMLEGIAGVFYLAVVISRLVSLYHRQNGSAQ